MQDTFEFTFRRRGRRRDRFAGAREQFAAVCSHEACDERLHVRASQRRALSHTRATADAEQRVAAQEPEAVVDLVRTQHSTIVLERGSGYHTPMFTNDELVEECHDTLLRSAPLNRRLPLSATDKDSAVGENFLSSLHEFFAAVREIVVDSEQREREHFRLGARPIQDSVLGDLVLEREVHWRRLQDHPRVKQV